VGSFPTGTKKEVYINIRLRTVFEVQPNNVLNYLVAFINMNTKISGSMQDYCPRLHQSGDL
jgi:hypothetical protein